LKYKDIKIGSNRSFGIVFFVVFLIIGLWPLINNGDIRNWSVIISAIFLVLGLLNSKVLTPLNKAWFRFGIFLGNFIAPIVMAIVYFLVVTPIGILMKIVKKDLINLKKNNNKSYWIEKNEIKSSMKNQF
jgi:large-conductance mechanosensitive channel|tara:strand:+ start:372 stop:761 length:390 start_codon:yes stop_codon:yes gene_type:complete